MVVTCNVCVVKLLKIPWTTLSQVAYSGGSDIIYDDWWLPNPIIDINVLVTGSDDDIPVRWYWWLMTDDDDDILQLPLFWWWWHSALTWKWWCCVCIVCIVDEGSDGRKVFDGRIQWYLIPGNDDDDVPPVFKIDIVHWRPLTGIVCWWLIPFIISDTDSGWWWYNDHSHSDDDTGNVKETWLLMYYDVDIPGNSLIFSVVLHQWYDVSAFHWWQMTTVIQWR